MQADVFVLLRYAHGVMVSNSRINNPLFFEAGILRLGLRIEGRQRTFGFLLLVGLNEGSTTRGTETRPVLLTAVKNLGQYNFL